MVKEARRTVESYAEVKMADSKLIGTNEKIARHFTGGFRKTSEAAAGVYKKQRMLSRAAVLPGTGKVFTKPKKE